MEKTSRLLTPRVVRVRPARLVGGGRRKSKCGGPPAAMSGEREKEMEMDRLRAKWARHTRLARQRLVVLGEEGQELESEHAAVEEDLDGAGMGASSSVEEDEEDEEDESVVVARPSPSEKSRAKAAAKAKALAERDLTDDELCYAEFLERFLCKVSKQESAHGDEKAQRTFSPQTVKRYYVAPAVDSPEPAPHNWREYRRNPSKVDEYMNDPVVQAFESKVKAWKQRKRREKVDEDLEQTRKYVEQETQFLDNSAMDDRIQYSDLRGWKRHDYSEKEIWDTVTRHGHTPTCEEVIGLQGTTHVQMYTLGMDEVVDYRETVRPIEHELNLQGVFNNYCPEHSQVVFHGNEKNFSNHDPVLFELEALGRLRWPGEDVAEAETAAQTAPAALRESSMPGKKRPKSRTAATATTASDVSDDLDLIDEVDEEEGIVGNMDQISSDASATDPFAGTRGDDGESYDDDTLYISDDATDNEDNMNYDQPGGPVWGEDEDLEL